MNKENFIHNLKNIEQLEPSNDLKHIVLQRIRNAEQKKMLQRLWILRLAMSVSTIFLIGGIYFGGRELLNSDFWNIAMLGFSDSSLILRNWQTFAWSLMETLPVSAMAILLTPAVILMSLGRIYENYDIHKLSLNT